MQSILLCELHKSKGFLLHFFVASVETFTLFQGRSTCSHSYPKIKKKDRYSDVGVFKLKSVSLTEQT